MNDSMPQTLSVPALARGRWRKRLVWIGLTLLLIFLAFVGVAFYVDRQNERELREAEAEADLLDPGWRLQDLLARRTPVADAENGSPRLLAAAALIPGIWPNAPDPTLEDRVFQLSPAMRPGKKLLDAVKGALKQVDPAADLARQLAAYPRGRYAIAWSPDLIGTPLNHLQSVGRIRQLLYFDTLVRAENEDREGAAQSCLAALNAGRSLRDEPIFMSQVIRALCQVAAERAVERLLAQCELSEATLNKLQVEFAEEAAQPLLLFAFRSYRAHTHEDLNTLAAMQVNRRGLFLANPYGLPDTAINMHDALRARACHAAYLRYLTAVVEIAKLPPDQQGPRLEKLTLPPLVQPTLPFFKGMPEKLRQIHQLFVCTQALLRCAVAGLAVERYRKDIGQWPESMADLAPLYLREGQIDPFDGAALRYRRLADGVVIYSVGPDGKDHGGQIAREMPPAEGADVGFRLWDPAKRRQPAANKTASDSDR